jgi:hypothetical protein
MAVDAYLYEPVASFFYFAGPVDEFWSYLSEIEGLPDQSALVVRRRGRRTLLLNGLGGQEKRSLRLARPSSQVSLISLRPQAFQIEIDWSSIVRVVRVVGQVVDPVTLAKGGARDVQVTLSRYFARRPNPYYRFGTMEFLSRLLSSDPPLPGIEFTLLDSDRSGQAGSVGRRADRVQAAIWTSSDASAGHAIRDALIEFAADHDFIVERSGDEELGSWRQRFRLRARKAYANKKVQENLARAERRLELELLDKAAAEVDNVKADSASKLIAAIDSTSKAVVVLGQIVIVKYDGMIVVKSIDPVTAGRIEGSQTLLSDPAAVLQILSGNRSETGLVEQPNHPELEEG